MLYGSIGIVTPSGNQLQDGQSSFDSGMNLEKIEQPTPFKLALLFLLL